MADNRSIPTMVNGTSHFTQTGYKDKYCIKKQDLNPSKNDISLYGQNLSEKTECSDRYSSLHHQTVIKDSSPFGCHDGRDRRIAVTGENNNSYDRRIAVRAGSHTDRELLSPFHDRHSASSYTSSGAEESYNAHKSRKDNYSKEKSKISSFSGTYSSLHSSNRPYSSYRNHQSNSKNSDLMDIACTSSSSKMRTWETSDSDSPYKVSTSVTSKYEEEKDAEQNIIDKEKYEKQKKKELQKARRMHRKIKRLEALKQTESDIQLTNKKGSDTDCEDEVLSEPSPRKLKIDCDITSNRVRTSSQFSHDSSKPKHPLSKSSKSDKNSNTGSKDTTSSMEKLSGKEVIKHWIPFIDNADSRDTTAEEGELKSSESSQCDDSDFQKRNSANSGVSSNELKIIEELKKKNIEFQTQVKDLNFDLRTRKKSLTRQTKDSETKLENLEEFYQDELEALRKEVSYLKKQNDRERDITDNAKTKERDLLNKVRRLEDSLLHSGKEHLDLNEKLKRLTEENDSLRYSNYTRHYPPPTPHLPIPHPPIPHPPVTHPLEYGYQPPSWGH